jgi:hypothetical protein
MIMAAREMLKYGIPADGDHETLLNTVVFSEKILNTTVLLSKPRRPVGHPSGGQNF